MTLSEAEQKKWDKIGEIVGFTLTGTVAAAVMYYAREVKDSGQILLEGAGAGALLMIALLSRVKREETPSDLKKENNTL